MTSIFLFLFLFCFAVLINAHTVADDVLSLSSENATTILKDGRAHLVMFYAPWCGHCKRLLPIFNKASIQLKGHTQLSTINGDEQAALVARFQINGYPTLMHISRNGKAVRQYQGARTLDGIDDYCRSGYASVPSMSFWSNPLSVVGDALGVLIEFGVYLDTWREYLVSEQSMPFPLVVCIAISALIVFSTVMAFFIVWVLNCCDRFTANNKKNKRD